MKNLDLLGAAFLMATSSIGPGFLTQTTVFTQQLAASFGFVILITIILDIGAQLNVWRVIGISGKRGQDVANMVLPGLGYFVALLIVMGGEKRGISSALAAACDGNISIPYGRPFMGSLSTASAVAVLAFEVLRNSEAAEN